MRAIRELFECLVEAVRSWWEVQTGAVVVDDQTERASALAD